MPITIDVTAEHIKKGKRKNCKLCPIALAARGVIPEDWIWVDQCALTVRVDGPDIPSYPSYSLPEDAQEFIRRFDQGYEVEPISFEIDR